MIVCSKLRELKIEEFTTENELQIEVRLRTIDWRVRSADLGLRFGLRESLNRVFGARLLPKLVTANSQEPVDCEIHFGMPSRKVLTFVYVNSLDQFSRS